MTDEEFWIPTDDEKRKMTEQHECEWKFDAGDDWAEWECRCGEVLHCDEAERRLNEYETLKADLVSAREEVARLRSRFELIQETVNTPDGKMSVLELFTQLDRACNDTLSPQTHADTLEGK